MKRTLILSDIHANLPALEAILKDADNFDRLVFLGDLANFGSHPGECVNLLKKYNPLCIIGNHDAQIVSEAPKHFWDKWSRKQLTADQLEWIKTFPETAVLDGHILLLHGSYTVEYDILPNTSDDDIEAAFKPYIQAADAQIDEVWFGHCHYHVERKINGITYRCMRPAGFHCDKDTRASYYILENGKIIQKRVEYNLDKTIEDFLKLDVFPTEEGKYRFAELLKNAYQPDLLKKTIQQMKINDEKNKQP